MGVISTFLILAAILIALKSAGQNIGWGFHLQSPWLVGVLALLFFAIGLNLLGVFEISGRLQGMGQGLTQGGGRRAAFFTGTLAVIAAAPCTAPFMGGAIGYALAKPAAMGLIVFMALAIGFSLPFLLIAYVPAFRRILPRPGAWMTRFKYIVSIPMFAASLWLVWIISRQAGPIGLIQITTAFVLLVAGVLIARSKSATALKFLAPLLLCGSFLTPFLLRSQPALAEAAYHNGAKSWSELLVKSELEQGKKVFVDFTADWCVTCKWNESMVLSKDKVKTRLNDKDVTFLIGDWTNADPLISVEIERHGRSGVPLYLVFSPETGWDNPQILSQTLSQKEVLEALK